MAQESSNSSPHVRKNPVGADASVIQALDPDLDGVGPEMLLQ